MSIVQNVRAHVSTGPVQLFDATASQFRVGIRRDNRVRRVCEWCVAFALTVAVSPVLLILALLVRTTSGGPVIFRQERVGRGGHAFSIFKFRTMVVDAEQRAAALFSSANQASGPLSKLHLDPRVTPVGRWMRRMSLDELPQLLNVLNGSMSLIGPRPALPSEVVQFADYEHLRHAVRPGMTGLAQVSGRSNLDWNDAVLLDLDYALNRSIWLDLRILLRTVPAVLHSRGAY